MDKIERTEMLVVVVIVVAIVAGVWWGGIYARQERRDGEVRAELRQVKRDIEMYFNQNNEYPDKWVHAKYEYVVSERRGNEVMGWYVSGALENAKEPSSGFNEEYNMEWRVTEEGNYEICGGEYSCLD